MTAAPKPFTLAIPDSELADLRARLALTRFPDELAGVGHSRGFPLADLRRLVARWQRGHDWRAREAQINRLPMFTAPIDVAGHGALAIHFVHQRSSVAGAIPLLFVHGWPGHFLEVEKMLPILTAAAPDQPSFHVVAPSLPGFGFSEGPRKPGFALRQFAEVCHKLMQSLGYEHYVTQGGDLGSPITRTMAYEYGKKGHGIKAAHTNFPAEHTTFPHAGEQKIKYADTPAERAREARSKEFFTEGNGYMILQATRPQTIGYSLADSPSGLLAYLAEKLLAWSDNYPWTDDEILDWVSIYQFSRAGPAASLRLYYEFPHTPTERGIVGSKLESPPFGVSLFPKEIFLSPLEWVKASHDLVFVAEHERGGHYAAFEEPAVLAGDLRKMFGKGGPAYGVVPGKDGY